MAAVPQLRGAAAFFSFLLLSVLLSSGLLLVSAEKFTVGDSQMWNANVNYTVWTEKHKPFHVGDWLVFLYQQGMADVVQVDEAGYNNCNASNPITNYSKGRSYAFQLNHTGNYYFICSRGYCYGGMRLAIVAEPLPASSPSPSAADRSAAPSSSRAPSLLALAAAAAAARCFFFYR